MNLAKNGGVGKGVRVGTLLLGTLAAAGWAETAKPEPEPRAFSIYPLGDRPGAGYEARIRGIKLRDAVALWFETDGIQARITGAGLDPELDPNASTPTYMSPSLLRPSPGATFFASSPSRGCPIPSPCG
jgi:hypothetical protein